MSDYSKITDFAAKDNLLTGNPAKLVRGSEIGAEFDAISTAVATKGDKTGKLSQFAATTSSELAGVISDETGTGLLVLSNSPVLSTPQINDVSSDHQYVFAVSELGADRTVTLPLLTGNDEFTFNDHTQTLKNKTLENPTINNGYTEESYSANASIYSTIDLANGTVQTITLDQASTTLTFPANTAGKSFLLIIKQDGTGGRTITWDTDVKWPSSTAPTLTSTLSKADVFSFVCDGTYWYGVVVGQNYL